MTTKQTAFEIVISIVQIFKLIKKTYKVTHSFEAMRLKPTSKRILAVSADISMVRF